MRTHNEERFLRNKAVFMEKCYDCFAEHGLNNVGIRALGECCGVSSAALYTYFDGTDDLIIKCTEYCMNQVEDDFMSIAPTDADDLERFINEVPYWTAEKHGKRYRLMYQIYTNPKYREYGKKFFEGVDKRYTEYAEMLEEKLGISVEFLRPMIFVFIRACVHYALYEDEFYLQEQLKFLKASIEMYKQTH